MHGRKILFIQAIGGILVIIYAIIFGNELIVYGYFFLCGLFVLARNKAYQVQLDAAAARLLDGPVPEDDFALYLRPFSTDQKMRKKAFGVASILFGGFGFLAADRQLFRGLSEEQELESDLRRKNLRLITVREPGAGQSEGAGTLAMDEAWRAKIRDLMVSSKVILFIGGASAGSRYELSLILENEQLAAKTVVIVPAPWERESYVDPAPRRAARDLWIKWSIADTTALPLHGFATIKTGGTASVISWDDTEKGVASFELSAAIEYILGDADLASINRIVGLPAGFCSSAHLAEDEFAAKAEELFPGTWKLNKSFIGDREKDAEILDYLDLVFASREAAFLSFKLAELGPERTGRGDEKVVNLASENLWLAELHGFL